MASCTLRARPPAGRRAAGTGGSGGRAGSPAASDPSARRWRTVRTPGCGSGTGSIAFGDLQRVPADRAHAARVQLADVHPPVQPRPVQRLAPALPEVQHDRAVVPVQGGLVGQPSRPPPICRSRCRRRRRCGSGVPASGAAGIRSASPRSVEYRRARVTSPCMCGSKAKGGMASWTVRARPSSKRPGAM